MAASSCWMQALEDRMAALVSAKRSAAVWKSSSSLRKLACELDALRPWPSPPVLSAPVLPFREASPLRPALLPPALASRGRSRSELSMSSARRANAASKRIVRAMTKRPGTKLYLQCLVWRTSRDAVGPGPILLLHRGRGC